MTVNGVGSGNIQSVGVIKTDVTIDGDIFNRKVYLFKDGVERLMAEMDSLKKIIDELSIMRNEKAQIEDENRCYQKKLVNLTEVMVEGKEDRKEEVIKRYQSDCGRRCRLTWRYN